MAQEQKSTSRKEQKVPKNTGCPRAGRPLSLAGWALAWLHIGRTPSENFLSNIHRSSAITCRTSSQTTSLMEWWHQSSRSSLPPRSSVPCREGKSCGKLMVIIHNYSTVTNTIHEKIVLLTASFIVYAAVFVRVALWPHLARVAKTSWTGCLHWSTTD